MSEETELTFDVYHDDQVFDIVERINELLINFGLQIYDESEEDLDYCTYRLVELDEVEVVADGTIDVEIPED